MTKDETIAELVAAARLGLTASTTAELAVSRAVMREAIERAEPRPNRPNVDNAVDKLMQAYEKAGLANVFYIEERYGKHSPQGYKRLDKRDE